MEPINYPITQRRLRHTAHIRELTAAVKLSHRSFIQPLFAEEGITSPRDVQGLPGVQVDTDTSILHTVEHCLQNGIAKFLLFPVPANKSIEHFDFSFAVKTVQQIKQQFGNNVWLATDVCLCSYTTHGHCGILNPNHTQLLNNETVQELSQYAALLAAAGADCVAPSDMTDGRIAAIRKQLDALGHDTVSIMSYAAKFSSQFYGPFRDACHSAPNLQIKLGPGLQNRKTYQLSPSNIQDALTSSLRDEQQGADILMVKPAALYTDVIAALKQRTLKPLAAYHVSGEYAAIEALATAGLLQREAAHIEVWTALQRSGADIIISYAAKHAKQWIEQMVY